MELRLLLLPKIPLSFLWPSGGNVITDAAKTGRGKVEEEEEEEGIKKACGTVDLLQPVAKNLG